MTSSFDTPSLATPESSRRNRGGDIPRDALQASLAAAKTCLKRHQLIFKRASGAKKWEHKRFNHRYTQMN